MRRIVLLCISVYLVHGTLEPLTKEEKKKGKEKKVNTPSPHPSPPPHTIEDSCTIESYFGVRSDWLQHTTVVDQSNRTPTIVTSES